VFENRVLRRIFGPKRDEVLRGWRKLYQKELHNLYSSPSRIRMIMPMMGRACSTNGENLNASTILVGKSQKKKGH
jgi:hypothetical protein